MNPIQTPETEEPRRRPRLAGIGILAGLVLTSSLAYLWPSFFPPSDEAPAWDPFLLDLSFLWALVTVTMFCLGMVVSRDELRQLKLQPTSVFLGVLTQCACMPALAWISVRLLGISGEMASGVILVGCVPGAMASNVLTMTARGNVSYSVSLTVVATLLSPVTVPLALSIVGGIATDGNSFNAVETAQTLGLRVVLPVVVGFALKELFPQVKRVAILIAPPLASVALLWIIASVVAGNRQQLSQIEGGVLLALLLINLAGYLAGYAVGGFARMPSAMRRALSLEVGMQNAGVGTALAGSLFGAGSQAQIPTAAYTFGCMLTGTLLAGFWTSVSGKSGFSDAGETDASQQTASA